MAGRHRPSQGHRLSEGVERSPALSVRVPESTLQRHEAITRVVREQARERVLRSALLAWRTARTLQLFLHVCTSKRCGTATVTVTVTVLVSEYLMSCTCVCVCVCVCNGDVISFGVVVAQSKVEVLYEEFFYKWLNVSMNSAIVHALYCLLLVLCPCDNCLAFTEQTRTRRRTAMRYRRAHAHYLVATFQRVFSTLQSRQSQSRQARLVGHLISKGTVHLTP
jgi:hypothetical protein